MTGYFNIMELFTLVHLSLDIDGLLSANTGKKLGRVWCLVQITVKVDFQVFADTKPAISNDRWTGIKGFNMLKSLSLKTSNNNNIN